MYAANVHPSRRRARRVVKHDGRASRARRIGPADFQWLAEASALAQLGRWLNRATDETPHFAPG